MLRHTNRTRGRTGQGVRSLIYGVFINQRPEHPSGTFKFSLIMNGSAKNPIKYLKFCIFAGK